MNDWTSALAINSAAAFLEGLTIRATAVLVLAMAATWLLRRRSAAVRHVVWVVAFGGLLVLPVLGPALPAWRVMPAGWILSMVESGHVGSISAGAIAQEHQPAAVVDRPGDRQYPRAFEQQTLQAAVAGHSAVREAETFRSSASGRVTSAERDRRQFSPAGVVLVVLWMIGFALCLSRIAASVFWLRWTIRRGDVVVSGPMREELTRLECQSGWRRHVTLIVTEGGTMPMACGMRAPAILLPRHSSDWTQSQRRSVLMHEFGHILRRDPLWKLMVEVGRAVYWFHPLVWLAARQVAADRERACDDLVLRSGVSAANYARHLLDVVTGGRLRRLNVSAGVAMASTNRLDRRVRSILDAAQDRRPLRQSAVVVAIGFATCLIVPIALLRTSDASLAANETVEKESDTDDDGRGGLQDSDSAVSEVWEVRLRAVDDQTGQPIPNPTFIVQLSGDRWTDYAGDERGEFIAKFANRTPRYCYLKVRADGYAAMQGFWSNRRNELADELPEQLVFEMKPSITVGGVVVDEDGEAVEGATVYFGAANSERNEGRRIKQLFHREPSLTDGEGRWQCSLVPPGVDSASFRVEHPDFVQPDPGMNFGLDNQIAELKEQSQRWQLKRGFTIRGRVVDGNGLPVEGAVLAVGELNLYRRGGPFPRTDADGRFEFPRVAAMHAGDIPRESHRMTITALKPGFAPAIELLPGSGGLELGASTPESRIVDLTLLAGNSIGLEFRDSSGDPVPDVRVRFRQWKETDPLSVLQQFGIPNQADTEGKWTWDWAPEGEVEYQFEAEGFRDQDFRMNANGSSREVILEREQVITGRVVDAETGEPIPLFYVELGYPNTRYQPVFERFIVWMSTHGTRGADGEYRVNVDWAGETLHYRVLAEGYESAESAAIKVAEGEVTLDFELHSVTDDDDSEDMSRFDAGVNLDVSLLAKAEGCLTRRFLILEALVEQESPASDQRLAASP